MSEEEDLDEHDVPDCLRMVVASATSAPGDDLHLHRAYGSAIRLLTREHPAAGLEADAAPPEVFDRGVDQMCADSERTFGTRVATLLEEYSRNCARAEARRSEVRGEDALMCRGRVQRDYALALLVLYLQAEHKGASTRGAPAAAKAACRTPRTKPWRTALQGHEACKALEAHCGTVFQDSTGSKLTSHMRACVAVLAFCVKRGLALTALLIEVGMATRITVVTAVLREWAAPGRVVCADACARFEALCAADAMVDAQQLRYALGLDGQPPPQGAVPGPAPACAARGVKRARREGDGEVRRGTDSRLP